MEKVKLPVVKEFPYDKIRSWSKGNPFTICYIYPKNGKPFIIKGGLNDIEEWLKEYKTPCVYYRSMWYHGMERGSWQDNISELTNNRLHFYISKDFKERTKTGYGYYKTGKYTMRLYEKTGYGKPSTTLIEKSIRRPPRCFPKELTAFI